MLVSDDIISYIMKFDPEVQERLMQIRFTALDVFHGVGERIYHGVPDFTLEW